MTIDEYARYRREDGMKVVKIDGIWWAEVRPFFFLPLFPFVEIDPWSKRYPPKAFIGGFLHVVPPEVSTTSSMNFFVYDDLQNYSLNKLSHKRKGITTQGIKNFTARTITDLDEFVATAFDVYKSFHERTNYWYKNNRVEKENFYLWAKKLFDNPKILKIGAYYNGKLSAVEISYYVENVIIGDTLFSDSVSLNLKVTDFMLHKLREAAAYTEAKYFYVGLPTGIVSLDESKLIRGCKILKMPAYCKINPVALSVARLLMKDSYQKLLEVTAPVTAHLQTSNIIAWQ